MSNKFQTIGIYGRHRTEHIEDTLWQLIDLLKKLKKDVIVEESTLRDPSLKSVSYEKLGKECDLVIVVGGDGSLLHAARAVLPFNTPILGINRGFLGFLTDISPKDMERPITEILAGNFIEEPRFILEAKIKHHTNVLSTQTALNDVVLLPGEVAHMIRFDVFVNDELMSEHRADGLIISTPTGSTAYSLSGGGPILHPTLNAIAIVPMFPHTLSSRPIVVHGEDKISIQIDMDNETSPNISCDGSERITIKPGDKIEISRAANQLRLIHPSDYSYFQTLRTKLGWQNAKV